MELKDFKITDGEINSLNVKSAADSYNSNSPQENKNIFDKLPEHIAQKHNALIEALTENGKPVQSSDVMLVRIGASGDLQVSVDGVQWQNVADKALEGKADKSNSYTKDQLYTKEETDTKLDKKAEADNVYTKTETDAAIARTVTEIGAGDMQKAVYDTDGDGVVDNAAKLAGKTPGQLTFGADQIITDEATDKRLTETLEEKMDKTGGKFTGDIYRQGAAGAKGLIIGTAEKPENVSIISVGDGTEYNRFSFRQYGTNGYRENYNLPDTIAPEKNINYDIITSKGGSFVGTAQARGDTRTITYSPGELVNTSIRDSAGTAVATRFILMYRK